MKGGLNNWLMIDEFFDMGWSMRGIIVGSMGVWLWGSSLINEISYFWKRNKLMRGYNIINKY